MSTELAERNDVTAETVVEPEEFVCPRFASIPGKDAVEMNVFMPGVPRDGATVSLVEDQLTIIGRRRTDTPEGWRPHFRELAAADYRLRVRLNIRVAREEIRARMEDGVLRLTLPIHGEAKPRRIPVT
jgi:HSP20 family molecular chaperone IbpA